MIVYHGSNLAISQPDVLHSRKRLDFGPGFYTTSLRAQAEKWVERYMIVGEPGIVNTYQLLEAIWQEANILRFPSYSEAWLDFVVACRRGTDCQEYDVIVGGIANDRVFNTCELYFKKYIDKPTALSRLRYEKPNEQICFKNQQTIDKYLIFEGSVAL